MFFDLIEPMHGVELPAAVFADHDFAAMHRSAGMITAIFNDLVSWPKEEAAGDHHNIVLALRHERRVPVEDAVRAAVAEHDALVEDFVAAREPVRGRTLRRGSRGRGGRRRLHALDPRQRRLVDGVRPVYAVGRHPRRRR